MPKLDLTRARRIKAAAGEMAAMKGTGFSWLRPSDQWSVTGGDGEIIINAIPTPKALEASGGAGQIVIGA